MNLIPFLLLADSASVASSSSSSRRWVSYWFAPRACDQPPPPPPPAPRGCLPDYASARFGAAGHTGANRSTVAPAMMASTERGAWNCVNSTIMQRYEKVIADGIEEIAIFTFDPTSSTAAGWRDCSNSWLPYVRKFLAGTTTVKTDDDLDLVFRQPAVVGVRKTKSIEKLGAYVMQAAETSPVDWNGRTLLVETVSGNTPGVYDCCSCTTFGCVNNASAHIGYSDCSACTCSAERKAAVGSCTPEFFRIRDANTLAVLVSPIPGTEGFGFASAFVSDKRLYGTNLINKTVDRKSTAISCFSTANPTASAATGWTAREVLVLRSGYSVFNTDVAAVAEDSQAPSRKYIMSIETNVLAGKSTPSWAVFFAETSSSAPDAGWGLVEPTANTVDLSRMTACPSVRFVSGWYYIATTTEGPPCPAAGWANSTNSLCVVVYRSKTLKSGSWTLGNGGQPIVAPGDSGLRDDRKVMAPWKPSAAELDAIHGHAPQEEGNINNSDFDFCDTPDGVFAVWAGIANQRSNPYFNIGGVIRNASVSEWLEGYFEQD